MAQREQIYCLMLIEEFLKIKTKCVTYQEVKDCYKEKFDEKGWVLTIVFN